MKLSRMLLTITFFALCLACDDNTQHDPKAHSGLGDDATPGDQKSCELQGDTCVSKGDTHCCRLLGVRAKIDTEARCLEPLSQSVQSESVCVLSAAEVCSISTVLTCYKRKGATDPDEIFVGSGSITLQSDEPAIELCDAETSKSMAGLTYCTKSHDGSGKKPAAETQTCKLEGDACVGNGNTHCCKLTGERLKIDKEANCLRQASDTPRTETVCVMSSSEVCINSPMRTCYKDPASQDPDEFFLGSDRVTL